MNCPICGNKLECKSYKDEHILVEEYEKCNKCHYYYEFAYGAYRIYIKGTEYIWSYKTNEEQINRLYRKMRKQAYSVQKRLRRIGKLKGKVKINL